MPAKRTRKPAKPAAGTAVANRRPRPPAGAKNEHGAPAGSTTEPTELAAALDEHGAPAGGPYPAGHPALG